MYEYSNDDSSVASGGRRACESTSRRLEQCPDAPRPVVAGGTLHGAGLAGAPQPPAGQGQRPRGPQANVEGVRSSGRRHSGQDEASRQHKRLAQMGEEPRDGRLPLHPQEQAAVVESHAPQGPVSVENVLRLLEHQQYLCALTGRSLTPQTAALDHIVPVRFGGEHVIGNTQVLHKDVNRAKGSLTSDEFTGLCRDVVRWSNLPTTRKDTR